MSSNSLVSGLESKSPIAGSSWPSLNLFSLFFEYSTSWCISLFFIEEFFCFLSNLNMNQSYVLCVLVAQSCPTLFCPTECNFYEWAIGIHIYSFTFETPSHLPPHPTSLGWYRAPVWVSWVIAALFTVARTWKQPRCPLTDEWIKKL